MCAGFESEPAEKELAEDKITNGITGLIRQSRLEKAFMLVRLIWNGNLPARILNERGSRCELTISRHFHVSLNSLGCGRDSIEKSVAEFVDSLSSLLRFF